MIIAVTGGREIRPDADQLKAFCDKLKALGASVREGEAPGVDRAVRKACEIHDVEFERYPANWIHHGSAAGDIRNGEMLRGESAEAKASEGPFIQADLLVAWAGGTGTNDCKQQAKGLGIRVVSISKFLDRSFKL